MAFVEFVRATFLHPNPRSAADYMIEAFGAEEIYDAMNKGIASKYRGFSGVSINVGGVEWQFVNPGDDIPYAKTHYEKYGNCLGSMTYYVDEYESYLQKALKAGCTLLDKFDVNAGELNYPGASEQDRLSGVVIDAMPQAGLVFVLINRPMFHDPNLLPREVGKIVGFNHFEVGHLQPYDVQKFMEDVFGAERVEVEMSSAIESMGPGCDCVHMVLGGVILQFIHLYNKPVTWHWHKQLHETGAGLHNTAFYVNDILEIEKVMERLGMRKFQMMHYPIPDYKTGEIIPNSAAYVLHGESVEECCQGWEVMDNKPLFHTPWQFRVSR